MSSTICTSDVSARTANYGRLTLFNIIPTNVHILHAKHLDGVLDVSQNPALGISVVRTKIPHSISTAYNLPYRKCLEEIKGDIADHSKNPVGLVTIKCLQAMDTGVVVIVNKRDFLIQSVLAVVFKPEISVA